MNLAYAAYAAYGFYLLIILLSAMFAVFARSLVRALVGLIGSLTGVAGMYLLMQAPFLAFMQVLIYMGAVCVLIFFAIRLAEAHSGGDEARRASGRTLKGIAAGLTSLAVLLPAVILHPSETSGLPVEVPLSEIGRLLLEKFTLPFELISLVLLAAMAGGVFLVREVRKK